jgi:hypothetical protein
VRGVFVFSMWIHACDAKVSADVKRDALRLHED